jgi:hypothetical protein
MFTPVMTFSCVVGIGMGMADMNTVKVVNMTIAVAISTPALAIAKWRSSVGSWPDFEMAHE